MKTKQLISQVAKGTIGLLAAGLLAGCVYSTYPSGYYYSSGYYYKPYPTYYYSCYPYGSCYSRYYYSAYPSYYPGYYGW